MSLINYLLNMLLFIVYLRTNTVLVFASITEQLKNDLKVCENIKIDAIFYHENDVINIFYNEYFMKFDFMQMAIFDVELINDTWPNVETPLDSVSRVFSGNTAIGTIFVKDMKFWTVNEITPDDKFGKLKSNRSGQFVFTDDKNDFITSIKGLNVIQYYETILLCFKDDVIQCKVSNVTSDYIFLYVSNCRRKPTIFRKQNCNAMSTFQRNSSRHWILVDGEDFTIFNDAIEKTIIRYKVGEHIFPCNTLAYKRHLHLATAFGGIVIILLWICAYNYECINAPKTDLKNNYVGEHVDIGSGWGLDENYIWTLKFNALYDINSHLTPLVLIHGFGSGVGFWVLNLDALSSIKRRLYAFDVLGFGRSSRPYFDSSTNEVEWSFVESIERWRIAVNLNEKFILLGHGMGAYLALSYALHFPNNVAHLVMVDAWGIESHQQGHQSRTSSHYHLPVWVKVANALLQSINPLTPLRAAGPWGLTLLQKLRPDLKRKFIGLMGNKSEAVLQYIYHCNAQVNASGETAFKTLSLPNGWPRYPMMHRIGDLKNDIGLAFIYGSRTWNDTQAAFQIASLLGEDRVTVNIIQGAGHHVFADKPREFNEIVNFVCQFVDTKLWNNID